MPPDPHRTLLEQGREAHRRREWRPAFEALTASDAEASLSADDLWLLATCAYLVGEEASFVDALERAHQLHRQEGAPLAAARCAFWLALHMAESGARGQSSGWFGRMSRLVDEANRDCPERGFLLLATASQEMAADPDAAAATAARAVEIGQRFNDPDLLAFALHAYGRARLRAGNVSEGLALLDEAMVAVTREELSPHLTGLIYCSVIAACREVYALARADEWTSALSEWCERQPDMVAYTGQCRLYRAEILQLRGAWPEAIREARRASERPSVGGSRLVVALAHYQQGEVHRLRGELAAAEEAYREASRAGREPQPGLALLRLAQGDVDAAATTSRRALAGARQPRDRGRLLPAHIEILLAAGAVDEAAAACDELESIARSCAPGMLDAVLEHARGSLALERDEPLRALGPLRAAAERWHAMDAPYPAARARELLARCCQALGDDDAAALELDAARATYDRLGAALDLARVDAARRGARRGARSRDDHGLTPRELEVLTQLATGRTNRAIGEVLFISEKTVARHVANIFAKLGLSSRAAATAYAYDHDLLQPPA